MIESIINISEEIINEFDCGIEELNSYLKKYARLNTINNISITYILIENNKAIGYYSLSNAQILYKDLNEEIKKGLPKYPISAIRLARLAVSKDEQNKGYGKKLLEDSFIKAVTVSNYSGTHFMIVDAKDNARLFYEQYGFIELKEMPSTYVISIKTIEKAINNT